MDTSGKTISQGSGIITNYESDWSEDDLGNMDNEGECIDRYGPHNEDLANGRTPYPSENPISIPPISAFSTAE